VAVDTKRSLCRFNGWCWPNFSNRIMASRLGPAKPRGVTWNGAGGWVIASHARQENFSRTVWITFHRRGITSSVSVISSPSFESFVDPQHGQLSGAAITTRSRGRWSGNGLRAGRLRWNDFTVCVLAAAFSAASSSSVAVASSSSS
jgi:hypothetical protein